MAARLLVLGALLLGATATAAPVRMRFPEGPAHGFVALKDLDGKTLAHGELLQWMRGSVVASRLVFYFQDGSRYDELVEFTQRPVFRVTSYKLVQHGPSFTEATDVAFDRSGHYRVRRRAKPGADEETAEGRTDLPADVSNGMTSTLLKNLMPDGSATTHLVVFRPKPMIMACHLDAEGTDRYGVGTEGGSATRYRVQPEVQGVMGAFASVTGKQPSPLHMWIARGVAPTLVRFEGPLYADGPTWRVELGTPRWD